MSKKLTIQRNEVPYIIEGLAQIKGMKDFKKAITLGDDRRKLRKVQEETEEAAKLCKPEKYDSLASEFQELKQKKAKEFGDQEGDLLNESEIGTHVMLTWPKAKDWTQANKDYQEAIQAISRQTVEIELQTEQLGANDFEKKSIDLGLAEVLSYFQ